MAINAADESKNYIVLVTDITSNGDETMTIDIKNIIKDDPLDLDTIGSGGVWKLKDPTLGLFGSYQQAQAITDSRKISDFYNHFI